MTRPLTAILTDTFDPIDAPVLAAVSAALARLDDRLAGSAPAVVDGWRTRADPHPARSLPNPSGWQPKAAAQPAHRRNRQAIRKRPLDYPGDRVSSIAI